MVALLMFLAFQFIGQAAVQTMAFLNHSHDPIGDSVAWALAISSLATIAAMLLMSPFRMIDDYKRVGCSNKDAIMALVILLLSIVAATAINDKIDRIFNLDMANEYKQLFNKLLSSPVGIVAICLLGPVSEEMVFRGGVMKPLLQRKVRPWTAILASAALFAVVHGNLVQMIFALMMGVVMGVIYYRTQSLILTSVAHIANNSVSALILLKYPELDNWNPEQMLGPIMFYILVAVIVVALYVLIRHFWHNTSDMEGKFVLDHTFKI